MAQEGFLYNVVSRLQSSWNSSDAIATGKDQNNDQQSAASADQSTMAKVSMMFKEFYSSYYNTGSGNTGSDASKQSRDDKVDVLKNPKKEHDDLLSEIRSVGGTYKLNKVAPIDKKEIKPEHDLTAVLSLALNKRKGVISEEIEADESEWDDN